MSSTTGTILSCVRARPPVRKRPRGATCRCGGGNWCGGKNYQHHSTRR